jgi:hypothetical protein
LREKRELTEEEQIERESDDRDNNRKAKGIIIDKEGMEEYVIVEMENAKLRRDRAKFGRVNYRKGKERIGRVEQRKQKRNYTRRREVMAEE